MHALPQTYSPQTSQMSLLKKYFPLNTETKKEAKDFLPIILVIIFVGGLLLVMASYLAKTV